MTAAAAALKHARALAADGAGLTAAMRQERTHLMTAIDAELATLTGRITALRPAAEAGDEDAADRVVAMTESRGELLKARAVLEGS